MNWWAQIEYAGELTDEQLVECSRTADQVYYDTDSGILRYTLALTATDHDTAYTEANDWTTSNGLSDHIADGRLQGPIRVAVENDLARSYSKTLLGAHEAAARLGVTTTRLRQLAATDGFPTPAIELVGGKLWHADEIDTWRRNRQPNKGGRPRRLPEEGNG